MVFGKLFACVIVGVIVVVLSACASVDRNAASSLANAGTAATQAISDQSRAAKQSIDFLPEWWSVRDALVCANVTVAAARAACIDGAMTQSAQSDLQNDLDLISDVMRKRSSAASTLRSAYQGFGNLVSYDASAEVQKSLASSFAAVNTLLAAAQKLSPAAALPPIGPTFTSAAGKTVGWIAGEHQAKLILAASHDLHTAVDSTTAALEVERDKAATGSLLAVLAAEQVSVYSSFVQSGLIAPRDALAPLAATIAPGVPLARYVPARNDDVINASAVLSFNARTRRQEAAVIATYDLSIAALKRLSGQHARLEERQSIDISGILSDVQSIAATLQSIPAGK